MSAKEEEILLATWSTGHELIATKSIWLESAIFILQVNGFSLVQFNVETTTHTNWHSQFTDKKETATFTWILLEVPRITDRKRRPINLTDRAVLVSAILEVLRLNPITTRFKYDTVREYDGPKLLPQVLDDPHVYFVLGRKESLEDILSIEKNLFQQFIQGREPWSLSEHGIPHEYPSIEYSEKTPTLKHSFQSNSVGKQFWMRLKREPGHLWTCGMYDNNIDEIETLGSSKIGPYHAYVDSGIFVSTPREATEWGWRLLEESKTPSPVELYASKIETPMLLGFNPYLIQPFEKLKAWFESVGPDEELG